MTYREAIQIQSEALDQVYRNAENLRDVAFTDLEKETWNELRRVLPQLMQLLARIDNRLLPTQALYRLKGTYNIKADVSKI